jgi:hypothetical protein
VVVVCWSRSQYRDWEVAKGRKPDDTWRLFELGTRRPAPSEPIVAEERKADEVTEVREEVTASGE